MTFHVVIPQPWAHLIITGQVDALPGLDVVPPAEACGQRVGIQAGPVQWDTCQRLLDRYPLLKFPTVPDRTPGAHVLWSRVRLQSPGKWSNLFSNGYQQHRSWVPDPRVGISDPLPVRFPVGQMLGSAYLAGWLRWEHGRKKPVEQYRPEGGDQRSMKLSRLAHGPICWVLRRPKAGQAIIGQRIALSGGRDAE